MAKRSVGSLFIDIEARTARLEADLAKTRGLLQRLTSQTAVMSRSFQGAFNYAKAAVAAFAGVQMVRQLRTMTLATLENVRAQMQLSEATGLGVNDLKAYEEASEHLGVTNLNLAKTMKELFALQSDVRAGNKLAIQQVQQMGYSLEQFARLKPNELFEAAVDGISRIGNVAQRSALAQRVFGKEATNLSSLLHQGTGAIKTARMEMERLGQTVSELDTAKVSVALSAVSELGDRWDVFKQRLAVGLTPLLFTAATRLADLLGSIDIDALAKKITGWVLAVSSFLLTIPERVRLVFAEVRLMWFEFISQFDTSDKFLSKIFGTTEENRATVAAIKAEIEGIKGSITSVGGAMEADFNARVTAILNKIATLPPVVSSVNTAISTGTKEMVEQFSASFQQVADISDKFLDGESIKFGDWFRDIVKTMVKTFLKVSLINPLLNSVFGGMMGGTSGGWWSALPSMFGGGRARGGPVMAGDAHIFGENGPELGVVQRSGYIVPTDRIMNRATSGGKSMVFNFSQNFATGLQKADLLAAIPGIIQQTKAAVADGVLRGGGFRRAVAG